MSDDERDQGNARSTGGREGSTAELGARAAPGLLRLAASAWWHTTEWAVGASLRAGSQMARAALPGDPSIELLLETADGMRKYAGSLLGLGGRGRASHGDGTASGRATAGDGTAHESLRERGAELLRQSADVHFDDQNVHPAYERILGELAPDEGRILRLLALEGPQPAIDVRSGLPVVNSQLVALGLSMIGAQAGCRHLDRVHAYLDNLNRLGLIWFSREPVEERLRYQVLEAQPDVTAAMRRGGRSARTVRRSIHLTPFGHDFCEVCLPLETADLEALPGGGPGDVEAIQAEASDAPG
jgi:hypothetical protein